MSELQIFENTDFGKIRTYKEPDGSVLLVAMDVAAALGYSNVRDAIKRHCKGVVKRDTLTEGGTQAMNCIPQGDVIRLAASSKLPGAEKFESWIFDEVIPSVLEHGLYAVDQLLDNPDLAIQAFTALKEERAKRSALETENAQQKQMIAEFSPKASYYDVVLQTKDVLSASKISKDYGKSPQWLNEYLHEKGVQYKQGKVWLLYQKYAEQGYTKSKTHTYTGDDGEQHSKIHTYWTQKGRLFIYDLLKQDGIFPLMEQSKTA